VTTHFSFRVARACVPALWKSADGVERFEKSDRRRQPAGARCRMLTPSAHGVSTWVIATRESEPVSPEEFLNVVLDVSSCSPRRATNLMNP
jgi:hypothetical protein